MRAGLARQRPGTIAATSADAASARAWRCRADSAEVFGMRARRCERRGGGHGPRRLTFA